MKLTIPCWPKDRAVEDARFLMSKGNEAEKEGKLELAQEYRQLAFMFKHRLPDCASESDLFTSAWSKEDAELEGKMPTQEQMMNDLSYHLMLANVDPGKQIGNVMRDLVKKPGIPEEFAQAAQDMKPEDLEEGYIKVGKVQDPIELARKAERTGERWGEDRYLEPERVWENPEDPNTFYTIADTVYYEHDRPKSRFKRGGIVEAAGFAQVGDIEAVRAKRPPKPLTPRPEIFAGPPGEIKVKELPPEAIEISEEVREELKKITPSARPKKARAPPSASIARCIINTRTLAQKLRDYDPAAKQSLQELADKLKELRHIEATTDDNEELNRVQAEIPRVERDFKRLKKMSPEAIRAEFEELAEKCPGVDVSYHDKLNKHSNVIRLHYKANATESQSLVVRDEAKQLYEQLLK